MARIVAGIGCSHTPQLSSTVEMWADHAERDRRNSRLLGQDGQFHTYDELLKAAAGRYDNQITAEVWASRHARAQDCVANLTAYLTETAPDVVLIIGDDQAELFSDDGIPALALFVGGELWDELTAAERDALPAGIRQAQWAAHGERRTYHPVAALLGRHLAVSLTEADFDLTVMARQPADRTLGHAFTFARHRLGLPATTPIIPVLLNTYYQPNVLSPGRCLALGRALRAAVESWPGAERVLVLASGGLSHYVVAEEFDRMVLAAIAANDVATLGALPRTHLRSGTSEVLAWLVAAAAAEHLSFQLIDYIPGYRTPAGTGTGMGFGQWSSPPEKRSPS